MMKSNENNGAVTKSFAKKMESISPFELKNKLIEMADESIKKIAHTMLNAGRGNPNWIATTPREAFFLLGKFGLEECRRVMYLPEGIAGIPQKDGIAARFETFLKTNHSQPGAELLKGTYQYMLLEHAADPDTLVHEWAEGVVGDQYPVPDRILQFTEMIVQDYLAQEMCDRRPPKGKYDLFATEGGTAAMCYVFDSLQENFLLNKGDGIALMVPVFTPYIEIPQLRRYEFNVTEISADQMTTDGLHTWQYKDEDIDRLRNPQIKALFITNPSNPPSYTLNPETAARIVDIVKKDNPNLMIITDDVYGTFSPHFRSLMAELPQNTLCVYSFSKYFGATGWRDAVIALHEENIFDRMIAHLPEEQKTILNKRYSSLTLTPEKLKFIDRMVADSRQVALNHTAGLSLPQQTQMSLFASFAILDKENRYKNKMQEIIRRRLKALWDNTGFSLVDDPLRVGYYSEIDMLVWAKIFYGEEFVSYLKKTYSPLDVVFRLANETSLVLLNGGGFAGPEWSVRVSLANLNEKDYVKIGQGIKRILDEYAVKWQESRK
ncbi:aspartate 4-decarboxylase [Bacteroides fragilis]|jgi:aspartate 4-decarboxylase|uniref:aspartate 4-decarboxylase n=1 Tax=Bacteroides fragilis TaxID=817 RepID=UPI0004BBA474|nr:aspartate 4-decarboxylase [Bacteroides fragilis]KAA4742865.1 aspartate 4-decarboxylase [Bacteroides fragilis]KAA4757618.1 aspartate 4-decarboxylase [Bacteroides fragilis]KAA4764315.1 aspartate 4-decarboxylase [Bacteroides fragilis]KAA4766455.1 aspartate 4-decarboxylase [Bacteroides fragilis]KAA4777764.1 aspartate 4-decarboxylase [Bacteroides fragilis]